MGGTTHLSKPIEIEVLSQMLHRSHQLFFAELKQLPHLAFLQNAGNNVTVTAENANPNTQLIIPHPLPANITLDDYKGYFSAIGLPEPTPVGGFTCKPITRKIRRVGSKK